VRSSIPSGCHRFQRYRIPFPLSDFTNFSIVTMKRCLLQLPRIDQGMWTELMDRAGDCDQDKFQYRLGGLPVWLNRPFLRPPIVRVVSLRLMALTLLCPQLESSCNETCKNRQLCCVSQLRSRLTRGRLPKRRSVPERMPRPTTLVSFSYILSSSFLRVRPVSTLHSLLSSVPQR